MDNPNQHHTAAVAAYAATDTSAEVAELFTALAKAQGTIDAAAKTSENPHFRKRYADLGAIWDAVREPLSAQGLSVVQLPRTVQRSVGSGVVTEVVIRTVLSHASGQWIADDLAIPVARWDAQGIGSAITYGRRYALASIAGVAPAEDDGEAAVGRSNNAPAPAPARSPSAPARSATRNTPRDHRAPPTAALAPRARLARHIELMRACATLDTLAEAFQRAVASLRGHDEELAELEGEKDLLKEKFAAKAAAAAGGETHA